MFLKASKTIKYKDHNILKEETDRKPKYIYSIIGTFNSFYKLNDAKKYIDNLKKKKKKEKIKWKN